MANIIQLNFQLIRAQRNLRKVEALNDKFKKSEKYKKLTADERRNEDGLINHEMYENWTICEEIKTEIFLKKIYRYGIPVPSKYKDAPERDKYWSSGPYEEFTFLTTKGYFELRNLLREEKKARRDDLFLWLLPLISSIGGLLGVATGVLTVLKYWNK